MKLRHFIMLAVCALAVSSCSIFRALKTDGKDGPTVYSYKKRQVDTIATGDVAFQFPVGKHAVWLDTLHFLNNQPYGDNQAVLIIHNDSIVYEKYLGDYSADHMATIFSITKSITSLLCGLDFDDVYSFTSLKDLKMLNAMAKLNYGHNIRKQVKGLKFRCKPGTQYRYESMTPAILGMVIERASGKNYAEYLSEKVWQPLGMNSAALGIFQQTLYVNPRKNLIIVRLGSSNRGYAYIPALFKRVANAWR